MPTFYDSSQYAKLNIHMIGPILALLCGFSFALNNIFLRRGVYHSRESFSPVVISIFLGTLFFGAWLVVSDQILSIFSVSWLGFTSLAGAGILHLLIGRAFAYTGIRLVGANRSVPIQTCFIIIAAVVGVLLFGEPMGISLAVALLLVAGGIALLGTVGRYERDTLGISSGKLAKGIFAALAAAICFGLSPILIKIGLQEVNSPIVATFISSLAAAFVISILLLSQRNREKLRKLDRSSLYPFIISSMAISASQILRYLALDYSPVSIVVPLTGTNSLFVFPLSFLMNRHIEAFNFRVAAGALAVVTGVFLLFWFA